MFLESNFFINDMASCPLVRELLTKLKEGHTAISYADTLAEPSPYVHQEKGFIALKSIFSLSEELKKPSLVVEPPLIVELNSSLLEEQKEAILFALRSSLTLLTGGPGTGKSFTIAELIRSYFHYFGNQKLVALAAPTGKASQHLQPLVKDLPVKLSTLQRLLSIYKQPFIGEEDLTPLPFDLIIVDEASMIDLPLMVRLFHHMKKGARLVLVGDKDQLPPVGFGEPFIDLMKLYPDHVMRLTRCMRSERADILALASALRENRLPENLELHWPPSFEAFDYGASPEESLLNQKKYRILSPLVEGPYGTRKISEDLFRRRKGSFFAPIIVTENDFKQGLYNGLLGSLEIRDGKPVRAYFALDSGIESFSPSDLPAFELAYAITVHKSQGSEFDTVYFVLPPGSEKFGKELLYTGVTRTRHKLTIAALKEQMELVVQSSLARCTGL